MRDDIPGVWPVFKNEVHQNLADHSEIQQIHPLLIGGIFSVQYIGILDGHLQEVVCHLPCPLVGLSAEPIISDNLVLTITIMHEFVVADDGRRFAGSS